ncbi:hypothetical protein ACHAXN_001360 [Cyclotella atomus]
MSSVLERRESFIDLRFERRRFPAIPPSSILAPRSPPPTMEHGRHPSSPSSFNRYLADLRSSTNCCRSASLLVPTASPSCPDANANEVLSKLRAWSWLCKSVLIQPWQRPDAGDAATDRCLSCLPCRDDLKFLHGRYSTMASAEELLQFHLDCKSLLVPLNDEATAFVLRVLFEPTASGDETLFDAANERAATVQEWMRQHITLVHNVDGNQTHSLSRECEAFPSCLSPSSPPETSSQLSNNSNGSFTFVDLFAGIGGFRLALQSLGGICLGSCEIDPHARDTYRRNFLDNNNTNGQNDEFYVSDISRLEIPRGAVDVLCGGFPCQSFSTLARDCLQQRHNGDNDHDGDGTALDTTTTSSRSSSSSSSSSANSKSCNLKRRGGLDTPNKGKLFFQLLRILRHSQPRVFVFENVKGLLHLDGGAHFDTILQLLRESGYNVTHGVVDTSWFLPQRRERVFFVGVRKDLLDGASLDCSNYVAFAPSELKRRYQIYANDVAENEADRFDRVLLKNQSARQRSNSSSSKLLLRPSRLGDILESEQTILSENPHTYLSSHQWSKISSQSYTQIHSDGSGQLLTRDDACAQTLVSSYRQSYLMHSQFVVSSDSLYLRRQNEQLVREARKRRGITCANGKTNTDATCSSNASIDVGDKQTLPRFFSPRECCRLQGFPEQFMLPFHPLNSSTCNNQTSSNIHERQQRQYVSKFYRQIGNSVSPPCVIAVVKDAIDKFVLNRQQCCIAEGAMTNPVFDAVRMANPCPERVTDLIERKLLVR